MPLQASDEEPPLVDDEAPFKGGLCECSGGEPDIIFADNNDQIVSTNVKIEVQKKFKISLMTFKIKKT